MRAIFVLFDSLNVRYLPPYGNNWVHAPNFSRLAARSAMFTNCYAGSLPCMPARREIHTGRYNFLHCPWGPLEPFDDSMPEILTANGVHTHIVSDHLHYWEDAGSNYNTRYSTWEVVRGQEGDPWKGQVEAVTPPDTVDAEGKMKSFRRKLLLQDTVNRKYMQDEKDFPQTRTFDLGVEFVQTNHSSDNWMLQIECFDPHEPFYAPERFRKLYPRDYRGKQFDWPNYDRVHESPQEVQEARYEYAALVSMCDHSLGRVLDVMDANRMWDDTMLIVGTDHGFLLGEHDWWAKIVPPTYNEVAHTPLFIWDPRSRVTGARRESLVQTIDFAPTLLELFGIERTNDMQGLSLAGVVRGDSPIREAGIFGIFGRHVCCTNRRYVYLRAPKDDSNRPLFEFTTVNHGRNLRRYEHQELIPPLSFTKGMSVLKRPMMGTYPGELPLETMLFDLQKDPDQLTPLHDSEVEKKMIDLLRECMKQSDAPAEQYERLGI